LGQELVVQVTVLELVSLELSVEVWDIQVIPVVE
jgi:hypothetical protein